MERYLGGNLDELASSLTAFLRAGALLNASDERLAAQILVGLFSVLSRSSASLIHYPVIRYRNTVIYILGTVVHQMAQKSQAERGQRSLDSRHLFPHRCVCRVVHLIVWCDLFWWMKVLQPERVQNARPEPPGAFILKVCSSGKPADVAAL